MHDSASARKALSATRAARFAFALLMLGNVALAFGPWLVRLAESDGGVGPIAAAFWRLAIAAPLILALTRATRQPIGRMPLRLWAIVALAGLLFAADLALWHAGILVTKMANATLFGNVSALLFPLYGFWAARALPSRAQGFAMLLATFGLGLLLGRSYELSAQNLVGDLLCLSAGVFYCLYLIAVDRARGRLKPWPLLALSTAGGVLPLLLFAHLFGENIWPADWTALIVLAVASQVIGQGLIIFAMGHVTPLVVGLCLLSQPIVAATVGWLAYGERMGALDLIGAVAIGVAILLVGRTPARQETLA